MQRNGCLTALLILGPLVALHASTCDAQSFYTGSGPSMFRVFGCPPDATLNLNGTGPSQQGECTIYQTGNVEPAVPIETWVSTQVSGRANGLQAENEKLQKQIDELTARVQALEAAVNRTPKAGASGSQSGAATK